MIPENNESSSIPKDDKPQLTQHTRKLKRMKLKGVIRCFEVGELANQEKFIAVGSQNNCLSILNQNLEIIHQITYSQWVRCVAIGDVDNDGEVEIVAGLGDKTVRLLKRTEDSWEEIGQFQCTGFVSSVSVANVTGPLDDDTVHNEVVVGSWANTVRVMRFQDGECDQVWHRTFDQKVLSIRVCDITGSGQNEVIIALKDGGITALHGFDGATLWEYLDATDILAMDVGLQDIHGKPVILLGGNEKVLSILNNQGDLLHQIQVDERITAIKIQDMDGSSVPDVVLGLGDKHLTVLSLADPFVESLHTKWAHRIHGVINTIQVFDINQDDQVEILFAGYDQAINVIQDNHYGVPAPFEWGPGVPSVMPEMVGVENGATLPTAALADGSLSSINVDQSLFRTSDDAVRSLGAAEPSSESTQDLGELFDPSNLSQTSVTHPTATTIADSRPSGATQAGNETKAPHPSATDDFRITGESGPSGRPQFVMQIFENVEFYPTKASLLAAFVSGGLTSQQSVKMFAEFKEMGFVRYQRTSPRGYYLISEGDPHVSPTPTKPVIRAQPKPLVTESTPFLEQAQLILSKTPYFATKALLITAMRDGGIPEKEILPSIEYFKTKSLLSYSRKTPRGYQYLSEHKIEASISEKHSIPIKITPIKAPTPVRARAPKDELSENVSTLLKDLFVQTPLFSSKASYLAALETQFQSSTDLTPDQLFLLFKNHGLVQYSRAKPRGYSLLEKE
jgi:hypothetical protein